MSHDLTPQTGAQDLRVVEPISPALAERHRRDRHLEMAALHIYEAHRLPTMSAWYDLPKRSRDRCRNAISIGASSLDMTRILREGR